THDPELLWKRAEHLAADTGVVTLARARVLPEAVESGLDPALMTKGSCGNGLLDARSGPLERMFGLSAGDPIMAVNGHPVAAQCALEAYTSVSVRKIAVVEVIRDRRLVALRVDPAR